LLLPLLLLPLPLLPLPLLLLPNLRLYKANFERCLLCVSALCIQSVLKLKRLRRRRRLNGWQRLKERLIGRRFQLSRRLEEGPFGSTSATLLWIVIAI
jgi:hypothetical protein